ncbi:hypothetical protein [Massilia scottii]|uniref:hypothetical protein n=1 Tax=Massilia scottii TaxID=3057166 RepID=UPI0027968E02|nr:hypothetical protein [Massilia sp. CCM 9029]MDQ1832544.1 hypothetical protein [Massilia sp. CCM 9029]
MMRSSGCNLDFATLIFMKPLHIATLHGCSIVRWVGTEMALSEGIAEDGPVLWDHPSVPYLQLISIDVQLNDGAVYRLLSHDDDGTGCDGLYLLVRQAMDTPSCAESGSIFRTRELSELPIGAAIVSVTDMDGPHAVLRVDIVVGTHTVSCWAAEVYERDGGDFAIVDRDESILIQVDGIRPVHKFQLP